MFIRQSFCWWCFIVGRKWASVFLEFIVKYFPLNSRLWGDFYHEKKGGGRIEEILAYVNCASREAGGAGVSCCRLGRRLNGLPKHPPYAPHVYGFVSLISPPTTRTSSLPLQDDVTVRGETRAVCLCTAGLCKAVTSGGCRHEQRWQFLS